MKKAKKKAYLDYLKAEAASSRLWRRFKKIERLKKHVPFVFIDDPIGPEVYVSEKVTEEEVHTVNGYRFPLDDIRLIEPDTIDEAF